MKKQSSVHLVINILVFSLVLFAHTITEKTSNKGLQKTSTVKKNATITLDQAILDGKEIEFSVEETVNLELQDTRLAEALEEGNWENMISIDNEGYQVLGGIREDPFRYQYEGKCNGIVTRDDTGEIIAKYEFRVFKLLAGETERFSDAFLFCKGTYWLPVPIQKPDREWKRIPPTLVRYEVPASGFGIMIKADSSIPGRFLGSRSSKPIESQFILSAELEPLFFGRGSVHVPVQ